MMRHLILFCFAIVLVACDHPSDPEVADVAVGEPEPESRPGPQAQVEPQADPNRQLAPSGMKSIDLDDTLPEDYDWVAYFGTSHYTTAGDWSLAAAAHPVLKQRIDELCTQYRELLISRQDDEALAIFNEMQEHWEKAAEAEIRFVGTAWAGGSGAKVAYARHRFAVYLRRVKELRDLKGSSMHLNE